MKKLLPLLAALAIVGCAEEPAEIDTTVEAPADVVTEPADDMMMDDTTMTDDGMMMEDSTMMEGEMMEDTTSTM